MCRLFYCLIHIPFDKKNLVLTNCLNNSVQNPIRAKKYLNKSLFGCLCNENISRNIKLFFLYIRNIPKLLPNFSRDLNTTYPFTKILIFQNDGLQNKDELVEFRKLSLGGYRYYP